MPNQAIRVASGRAWLHALPRRLRLYVTPLSRSPDPPLAAGGICCHRSDMTQARAAHGRRSCAIATRRAGSKPAAASSSSRARRPGPWRRAPARRNPGVDSTARSRTIRGRWSATGRRSRNRGRARSPPPAAPSPARAPAAARPRTSPAGTTTHPWVRPARTRPAGRRPRLPIAARRPAPGAGHPRARYRPRRPSAWACRRNARQPSARWRQGWEYRQEERVGRSWGTEYAAKHGRLPARTARANRRQPRIPYNQRLPAPAAASTRIHP